MKCGVFINSVNNHSEKKPMLLETADSTELGTTSADLSRGHLVTPPAAPTPRSSWDQQQVFEKVLNITIHQEKGNQNHNVSLYNHYNGYHPKDKK